MSPSVIDTLVRGSVLVVTISRPEARNAYSYAVERAWHDALTRAAADRSVRAVVLTATGDTFCPGFEAAAITTAVRSGTVIAEERSRLPFHLATALDKPVVCAINGACAGIGLALALTCDIRLAAAGARFSTAFGRLGLPAERGASWLLPRLVGHGRAAELLLTGRTFDAAEAERIGLVHKVVAPDELGDHALTLADRLATGVAPAALAAMKRQLYLDWNRTLDDAVTDADLRLRELLAGPDLGEAVASRAEGRPPLFSDPARQEM